MVKMSKEDIQKVKQVLSTEVIGKISDKAIQNIIRHIIFNPNLEEEMEWDWVLYYITKQMPELKKLLPELPD